MANILDLMVSWQIIIFICTSQTSVSTAYVLAEQSSEEPEHFYDGLEMYI